MEPYQDKILSDSGWKTRRVGRACTESRRDVIFNYESTAEERKHFAEYVLMASVGQSKSARHDGLMKALGPMGGGPLETNIRMPTPTWMAERPAPSFFFMRSAMRMARSMQSLRS